MVSINDQRVIWSDDGTLNDLSINLNDFLSGTEVIPFVAAEDFIYIASDLPFNHRYIELESVNAATSAPTVDIWFGNSWEAAVDIIDRTETSGVTLAKSGILQWNTDRLEGWERELDADDVDGIDTSVVIYNFYWMRLKFSADLTGTTEIKFIGHKFSDDDDLEGFYPDLKNQNLKTAWESAFKTDWKEQACWAARQMILDLKARNIMKSPSQLLDYEKFTLPSVHKTAEIIYTGLGPRFADSAGLARQRYTDTLNQRFFNVDVNRDGSLSEVEKHLESGFLSR